MTGRPTDERLTTSITTRHTSWPLPLQRAEDEEEKKTERKKRLDRRRRRRSIRTCSSCVHLERGISAICLFIRPSIRHLCARREGSVYNHTASHHITACARRRIAPFPSGWLARGVGWCGRSGVWFSIYVCMYLVFVCRLAKGEGGVGKI